MLGMVFETGHPWMTWKDPSNVRSPQDHMGVVHSSNLCTEILLNTSKEETKVCNLGSVNLAAQVTGRGIDARKLKETGVCRTVCWIMLLILIIIPPLKPKGTANQRHRPVGLGRHGISRCIVPAKPQLCFPGKRWILPTKAWKQFPIYALQASR